MIEDYNKRMEYPQLKSKKIKYLRSLGCSFILEKKLGIHSSRIDSPNSLVLKQKVKRSSFNQARSEIA